MSEMIELAAKAAHAKAYETRGNNGVPLSPDWREVVRAAITAMRNPTEAMADAGELNHVDGSRIDAISVWQSMIDAALK